MKRRDFLAASCAAGAVGVGGVLNGAPPEKGGKQYLELRHYEIESAEKRDVLDGFLGKAAIPALNRLGVKPVGVFKMAEGEDFGLWVLIPHDSMECVIGANTAMLADAKYQKDGAAVLTCPKNDPVYKRMTSSLLLGFDACPKVEVPSKKDTRLFQLRIYESHNTTKAKLKVEMFNKRGEIAVFRETGLDPVFFGESIVGDKMPNLTYMVGFDDADAQKKAWSTFGAHPEWQKMRSEERYKGTVSNITNLVLLPTKASQI